METLPREMSDILEKVLGKDITDFRVALGEGNSKGMGFLSELSFVTVTHKSTGEEYHLAIKQALPTGGAASMQMMRSAFSNEIHFYLTCWPTFRKFQESYPLAEPFRGIARCYGAERELEKEKLVLENLKVRGFSMYERTKPFDLKHMEAVFKAYAKFHAISLAYRNKQSEDEFEEMTKPLDNMWKRLPQAAFFPSLIEVCCKTFMDGVEPELGEKIGKKLAKYREGLETVFSECVTYNGDCPVLVHGDCWSSNFMFKYNESKEISELKLIDFQIARRGSPVHDLSYCLYSCASEKVLQNLDNLLSIYHDTLSTTLETFCCAVEDIYPVCKLKEEWRKYSKYGLMLGLVIWKSKLTEAEDVGDLNRLMDNDMAEMLKPRKFDSEKYARTVSDMIMNAYKYDAL